MIILAARNSNRYRPERIRESFVWQCKTTMDCTAAQRDIMGSYFDAGYRSHAITMKTGLTVTTAKQ
jgi:hypothetical protein